jgi:hypothetical protein
VSAIVTRSTVLGVRPMAPSSGIVTPRSEPRRGERPDEIEPALGIRGENDSTWETLRIRAEIVAGKLVVSPLVTSGCIPR